MSHINKTLKNFGKWSKEDFLEVFQNTITGPWKGRPNGWSNLLEDVSDPWLSSDGMMWPPALALHNHLINNLWERRQKVQGSTHTNGRRGTTFKTWVISSFQLHQMPIITWQNKKQQIKLNFLQHRLGQKWATTIELEELEEDGYKFIGIAAKKYGVWTLLVLFCFSFPSLQKEFIWASQSNLQQVPYLEVFKKCNFLSVEKGL